MGRRLGKFDLGILGIQNLIPIAAFHGIFEYSSNNMFQPSSSSSQKIFEYSYLVHLMLTNIFIFVFGPEVVPEYIGEFLFVFVLKRTFRIYSYSYLC